MDKFEWIAAIVSGLDGIMDETFEEIAIIAICFFLHIPQIFAGSTMVRGAIELLLFVYLVLRRVRSKLSKSAIGQFTSLSLFEATACHGQVAIGIGLRDKSRCVGCYLGTQISSLQQRRGQYRSPRYHL